MLPPFGPRPFGEVPPLEGGAAATDAVFQGERDAPGKAFLLESPGDPFDPEGLDKVAPGFWGVPPGVWHAQAPARAPGENQPGEGGEGVSLPPVYLGVLPLPSGEPLDPETEGYRYLCGYAGHAIRAAERRAGPLRDHEDIIQQICVEWLEKAGPPAEAFPKLLEKAPAEMQLLRETVNRVIARVIYQQRKRLVAADFADWPARANPAEQDWVEFKSDCERGVGSLTRQEWQILELRRQGKTFAEIGSEMRMPKQRVWEVYHGVEARLQKIYGNKDV
jgi:hypothetical protein